MHTVQRFSVAFLRFFFSVLRRVKQILCFELLAIVSWQTDFSSNMFTVVKDLFLSFSIYSFSFLSVRWVFFTVCSFFALLFLPIHIHKNGTSYESMPIRNQFRKVYLSIAKQQRHRVTIWRVCTQCIQPKVTNQIWIRSFGSLSKTRERGQKKQKGPLFRAIRKVWHFKRRQTKNTIYKGSLFFLFSQREKRKKNGNKITAHSM